VSLKTLPKPYLIHSTDVQTDGSTESSVAPGPTGIPRTTPRDNQFQLATSRATTPNVFDPQTNSTRPIKTDPTNGALGNAPSLLPGIGFAQNPARPGTALDPALGGVVPSTPQDANMTSPVKSRDEERAEHNAREAAARQQAKEEREHEQRKAHAARQHQEMLRNGDALGDFESDEAEDNMDTDPTSKSPTDTKMDTDANNTSSTDTNMDAAPTGDAPTGSALDLPSSPFRGLVAGSAEETTLLRALPWNADGKHDDLYRGNNYMPADDYDGEPIWR
jgi:hypothetical protein